MNAITFASIKKSAKKSPKKSSSIVVELDKVALVNGKLTITPFYLVITNLITPSRNDKTRDMIQTYFLRRDQFISPSGNVKTKTSPLFGYGCSTCPANKICYVSNTTQTKDKGLGSVRGALFKLLRGEKTSYQFVTWEHALQRVREAEKKLRLGTYGDPSALSVSQIEKLVSATGEKGHTGYTHYWRAMIEEYGDLTSPYSHYLMASCETEEDRAIAEANGFRAFIIRPKGAPMPENVTECLNSTENKSCLECGLCDGRKDDFDTRQSIGIYMH